MNVNEEEKLPNKFNLGIWLRIGKYALRKWPILLVIVLTMLVTTFYDSSFVASMNKGAIDALDNLTVPVTDIWSAPISVKFLFGNTATMTYLTFLILEVVMIIMRSLAIFWTFFLTNYIDMCIMTDLRRDTFKRVQELSFSYFDKVNSGWLIARMNNDTGSIGDVLSWDFIQIFWSSFDLIFTVATMFSQNWIYALIVLASVPLVAIVVPIFEKALLKRWRTARNAYSRFVGWLAEAINGSKTIKTLSIEDEVADEAREITDDIKKKRWRAGRMNAFFQPLVSLISSAMIAIVVAVGLKDIGAGNALITVGTLVIFVGFVQSIYNPLQSLSEIFSDFMASQAGAEKVGQLLDAKPSIVDGPEVVAKYGSLFEPKKENYEPINGTIDFKDVTFDYGNGVEVIHPLTLHIKEGTSLAIVGETGSGKTTMVNLLCRFYEPTKGTISIDDVNYLDRSVGWLRSGIGYVQQSPFAWSLSYKENIRYGKRDATDEEIVKAAKLVGLHDFIMAQPQGYDTVLEDGGSSLSQGQKQLLSFARAIIRDPSILILDEATSSIDTETEAAIQKAIQPLLKGRTSITIAHRLSTIVNSDRILVMDHGSIVEDGDHVSLMNKKGAYYELYMNQFRDLGIESQISTFETQIENRGVKL